MLNAAMISTLLALAPQAFVGIAPAATMAIPNPRESQAIATPAEVAIAVTEMEQLSGALAEGQWEKGNRLTSSILLKSVNQYGRGYLITDDIRKLPCKTLRSVDHKWVTSSNGDFGLSTQAKIWMSIGGKTFDDVTKFEDRIGWLGPVDFLSTVTAPDGHLPLRPVKPAGMPDAWGGGWIQSMTQRLITCNIIPDPNPKPKPEPQPAPKPTVAPTTNTTTPSNPSSPSKPNPSPIKTPPPKPAPAGTPTPDGVRLRDLMNR